MPNAPPSDSAYPPLSEVLQDVMCAFDGRAIIESVHREPQFTSTPNHQPVSTNANWAQPLLWPRVHTIARQAAAKLGLAVSDTDIIVKSRPDVLFFHGIDAPKLDALFANKAGARALLLHHKTGPAPAGFDPSEVIWITCTDGYVSQLEHSLLEYDKQPSKFHGVDPKMNLVTAYVAKGSVLSL
jgi:hypothetical protein